MHTFRLLLLVCSCFIMLNSVSWAVETAQQTATLQHEIPAPLLDSADAILRGGGYRPAATAYAQLQVRFGSSDEIFTRRFVAQIACHDWDQAAVVLASAQVAEYHISRVFLPEGLLALLLPGNQAEVADLTERLAAWALTAADQREAMQLMAVWLQLAGDDARAALFFSGADQIPREESIRAEPLSEPPASERLPPPAPQLELPPPPSTSSPNIPLPVVPDPITATDTPTPRSKPYFLAVE